MSNFNEIDLTNSFYIVFSRFLSKRGHTVTPYTRNSHSCTNLYQK